MNAKQKKFILKKLIPFILREQGRGFAMSIWNSRDEIGTEAGETVNEDNISRRVPVCGTVCCIGGSAEVLNPKKRAAKSMGLTDTQASALFYEWVYFSNDSSWPAKFASAFARRKTPLGKAKVAVALLKEVVRTNGKCLERD